MGKYTSRSSQPQAQGTDRNSVNPYMRGIGCLLMLIVPAFAYGVGDYLAGQGLGAGILPPEWYGYISIPPIVYNLSGPVLSAYSWLASIPHLTANIVIAIVVIIVVGGILSIVFGYMYSILAPSKYGPTDVPAPRVKTRKYKR